MKLPDYFLADLPPEAVLTPAMIEEACQTLKRNRERYLAGRPTTALIRLLSETAESWLQPDFPFRKFALEQGPKATGFSSATLASGLDAFFRQLTAENLRALLVQELGHAQRLDAMSATSVEQAARRAALVRRRRTRGVSRATGSGRWLRLVSKHKPRNRPSGESSGGGPGTRAGAGCA